jgi:hypothetical protein
MSNVNALPQIRRLVAEDFPDQKGWIKPLFQVLNLFNETVVTLLDRKLNLRSNLAADIQSVLFTGVPTSIAPMTIPWNLNVSPTSIIIGNVTGITLATAVELQWVYGTAGLQIINLVGCTPTSANPVTLNLVIFTG